MDQTQIKKHLQRIQQILASHGSEYLSFVEQLIALCDSDTDDLYRLLNSKQMWGGAGSLANEALADNPGIDEWQWQIEIQDFRTLMLELGEHLMSRGSSYPDISFWMTAFNNWNQSGH